MPGSASKRCHTDTASCIYLAMDLASKHLAELIGKDLGLGEFHSSSWAALLLLLKIIIKIILVKISNVLFNILVSFNYSQL